MNDLSIDSIREKIKKVDEDIDALRRQGDASRRLEILNEYKSYLEDELKFLKKEQRGK